MKHCGLQGQMTWALRQLNQGLVSTLVHQKLEDIETVNSNSIMQRRDAAVILGNRQQGLK